MFFLNISHQQKKRLLSFGPMSDKCVWCHEVKEGLEKDTDGHGQSVLACPDCMRVIGQCFFCKKDVTSGQGLHLPDTWYGAEVLSHSVPCKGCSSLTTCDPECVCFYCKPDDEHIKDLMFTARKEDLKKMMSLFGKEGEATLQEFELRVSEGDHGLFEIECKRCARLVSFEGDEVWDLSVVPSDLNELDFYCEDCAAEQHSIRELGLFPDPYATEFLNLAPTLKKQKHSSTCRCE